MNRLIDQSSPYLLQHANNPVNWYPWCDEAFQAAQKEDKPIFLSIGYSSCHWCHVLAHECFEDAEVAALLNNNFIAIKVDKEERPDIDNIYMSVCQQFTGNGGWPLSIFMTSDQKPFYAGTYFPKRGSAGSMGFMDLLNILSEKWNTNRNELLAISEKIMINLTTDVSAVKGDINKELIKKAINQLTGSFDRSYGGFGTSPKFPMPHTLLFLLDYYEKCGDEKALLMAEKSLLQMYKGGIFDHIGGGFSRYSVDQFFLIPHFEKMLYDNALLLMGYTKAFSITNNPLYKKVAQKTAKYIMREMINPEGAFYSAQDADSEGVEGKYYAFDYNELIDLLGKEAGEAVNGYYGITRNGNFEGKSIPNLLANVDLDDHLIEYIPKIYEYRKSRTRLHLDDKILTSWNSLMIAAFAMMYRVFGDKEYLAVAMKANEFIEKNLITNDVISVSYRTGARSENGFLDDYASYTYSLIAMYEATLDNNYIRRAILFCKKALSGFYDKTNGGFYLYGKEHEQLIITPKETYDGAIPSGNSIMAYNLVKLFAITGAVIYEKTIKQHLEFMCDHAEEYPSGNAFFLLALSMYLEPSERIVCVLSNRDKPDGLRAEIAPNADVFILETPTDEYKLVNNKTTFYVCRNHTCLPPSNDLSEVTS